MKFSNISHSTSRKFILLVQQMEISPHDLNESAGAANREELQNYCYRYREDRRELQKVTNTMLYNISIRFYHK